MYESDKKVILTREDIVEQHKHDQLVECLKNIVAEGFFIAFCVLVTWSTVANCANWFSRMWVVCVVMILLTALFWFVAVMSAIATVQSVIRLLYLRQGKYAIEIDRVGLLKLKTEKEYKASRSGRGGHTEIVTNQYVYFEKYDMVKSGRPLKSGQECYLLVVLTKKPHVRGFWECDIHEIQGI